MSRALQLGFHLHTAHRALGLCLPPRLVSAESVREAEELDEAGWREVSDVAAALGVQPLLGHSLDRTGLLGAMPASERSALTEARTAQERHNSEILAPVGPLFARAAREGWRIALMKEASLPGEVYPGIGLRYLKDVDLLAQEEQLPRVEAFVREELGSDDCDFASQMPARRRFWPLPLADAGEMLDRAEEGEMAGVPVRRLAPEDNLIWLCWHDFDHGWRILPRLLDVIWFVEAHRSRLRWEEVLRLAERWGIAGALYPTLAVAESTGNAPIPPSVTHRLREAAEAGWVDELIDAGMWFGSPHAARLRQWWRVAQWYTVRGSVAALRSPGVDVADVPEDSFRRGSRLVDSLAYAAGYCEARTLWLWRRLARRTYRDATDGRRAS